MAKPQFTSRKALEQHLLNDKGAEGEKREKRGCGGWRCEREGRLGENNVSGRE